MIPARSFNPALHPRRAARIEEARIAERARALAPAMTAKVACKRLGIKATQLEAIAARHGFQFIAPAKE